MEIGLWIHNKDRDTEGEGYLIIYCKKRAAIFPDIYANQNCR